MEQEKKCTSCGIRLAGLYTALFPCPACGEVTIGRCKNCKVQSQKYVCPGCGFQGP